MLIVLYCNGVEKDNSQQSLIPFATKSRCKPKAPSVEKCAGFVVEKC